MIILEGTDAVGKTSVIKNLSDYELLDRDKNICSLMEFGISLYDRVAKLRKYLDESKTKVIFLVNNDKKELERRVNARNNFDEYDKYAYLYNLLYLETYLYMEKNDLLNGQLFMIDCTGLTIAEETWKVKEKAKQICQM